MNSIKNKRSRKAKRIVKNPRFYNDVKQKLKSSIRMLSNIKQGCHINSDIYKQIAFNKIRKNKEQSVISIIRRKLPSKDSRPFSAFPNRTQTWKFVGGGNADGSPTALNKRDNNSIDIIRGIQSGFCFKRLKNNKLRVISQESDNSQPVYKRNIMSGDQSNIFSSTFTFENSKP